MPKTHIIRQLDAAKGSVRQVHRWAHNRERAAGHGVSLQVVVRTIQKHWQASWSRVQELERLNAKPQSVRPLAPNKIGTTEELQALGRAVDNEAQRIARREENPGMEDVGQGNMVP